MRDVTRVYAIIEGVARYQFSGLSIARGTFPCLTKTTVFSDSLSCSWTSIMADAVPPHEAAFEAQFDYMVDSIDAGSLAPACLAAGLINDRQRDECFRESSAFKKAELLLGHVKRSIKGDGTKFDTFVAILRKTGHKTQADKLSEYWHVLIVEINLLS